MERGIRLTAEQRDELEILRLQTHSAKVFRNCLIVLQSDAGESKASIARQLGCATDTVARTRRLYQAGGAAALHPVKPPGRTPRATPEFIATMKQLVKTHPQTLGYGFARWSSPRLAEHLARVTAIRLGSDQLLRVLARHDCSFQRPKHTLKGKRDEAAYEQSRGELDVLKKTPSPKPRTKF